MRIKLLFIVAFFSSYAGALIAQNQKADYLFTNVNIVDVVNNRIIPNQSIVVFKGEIVEISKTSTKKADSIINGNGSFVMVTLGDAHVHFPATEVEMEKLLKLNLINGVTKVRSMRGEWEHLKYREKFNASGTYYPQLYLTPPFIHRNNDMTDEQIDLYVKSARENKMDQIKILSIRNSLMFQKFSDKAKEYNVPLGGHFPVVAEGFMEDKQLFESSYSSIEHLGGLIGQPERYQERVSYIVDKQIYICPTLKWYAIGYGQYSIEEMIAQRGMQYIDREEKDKWVADTEKYRGDLGIEKFTAEKSKYELEMEERFKVLKELDQKGVGLLLSPDSSSRFVVPGFGILEEMMLYQKAGLSNASILKAGTLNIAKLFQENYGTIEVGKTADFMLLKENPLQNLEALQNIVAIFYNNTYLNRDRLDEIAKSIVVN